MVGKYAAECLKTMRQAKVSARKYPPSSIEIAVSSQPFFSVEPQYNDHFGTVELQYNDHFDSIMTNLGWKVLSTLVYPPPPRL